MLVWIYDLTLIFSNNSLGIKATLPSSRNTCPKRNKEEGSYPGKCKRKVTMRGSALGETTRVMANWLYDIFFTFSKQYSITFKNILGWVQFIKIKWSGVERWTNALNKKYNSYTDNLTNSSTKTMRPTPLRTNCCSDSGIISKQSSNATPRTSRPCTNTYPKWTMKNQNRPRPTEAVLPWPNKLKERSISTVQN